MSFDDGCRFPESRASRPLAGNEFNGARSGSCAIPSHPRKRQERLALVTLLWVPDLAV